MIQFKLPSLGSDMDEGKLLEWQVAPGQAVKKGDILAVVDTSKAAIDIECWVDATVHRLISKVGDMIPVGTVMAELLAPGETAAPGAPEPLPAHAKQPAPQPAQPAAAATATAPATAPAPAPAVGLVVEREARATAASAETAGLRRRVSPAARRRAHELGVNPERLKGSGPAQAVTLADVEHAASGAALATPDDRHAAMRSAIAAAMSRSKREIPHYYLAETIPMRAALDWLHARNQALPVTERLLPAALLLKAVALTLRDAPELNGQFVDGRFTPSSAIHIGVAISLRQGGLIAPALRDVDGKPLPQLMRELVDLVQRCRAGSLRSSELADAGITVTHLGDQGVQTVFGVIYPPQVALIGLGRIGEQPWVDAGNIVAMPTLQASLAADHRVSDGHRGALFLRRLREQLQRPAEL